MLKNVWKGYNSTIFAYGQTGSGKSFSIMGHGANKGREFMNNYTNKNISSKQLTDINMFDNDMLLINAKVNYFLIDKQLIRKCHIEWTLFQKDQVFSIFHFYFNVLSIFIAC